jgi:hypothetical protein
MAEKTNVFGCFFLTWGTCTTTNDTWIKHWAETSHRFVTPTVGYHSSKLNAMAPRAVTAEAGLCKACRCWCIPGHKHIDAFWFFIVRRRTPIENTWEFATNSCRYSLHEAATLAARQAVKAWFFKIPKRHCLYMQSLQSIDRNWCTGNMWLTNGSSARFPSSCAVDGCLCVSKI